MKNSALKNVVTATAFSLGIVLAGQAGAEAIREQDLSSRAIETHSISIPYSNTDLATDQGREKLYDRIKRAARQVCGPTGPREAGGLRFASQNHKCYQSAMEAALNQVAGGQLASLANW